MTSSSGTNHCKILLSGQQFMLHDRHHPDLPVYIIHFDYPDTSGCDTRYSNLIEV